MDTYALPDTAPRQLCVVMHDVGPDTWAACEDLLDKLATVAPVTATLLLVPHYHHLEDARTSRVFCETMDRRRGSGDELALHGFYHLDDQPVGGVAGWIKRRLYTASEGEFSELSAVEALARLHAGMEWFQSRQWPLDGFVAPAWLLGERARKALNQTPFLYTTSLNEIDLLQEQVRVRAPCITYSARSALRRQLSAVYLEARARTLRNAPIVRLGLHPVDAQHPAVVAHWQRLFAMFSETHQIRTKGEVVRSLRESLAAPSQALGYPALRAQISHMDTRPIATPKTAPASTSLG